MAHLLDNQGIMMAYKAFVRSKIEYGNLVYWGSKYQSWDAEQSPAERHLPS